VHLLDLQTRQRLQQIIRALKLQEQQFQDALWERLKYLQSSADEWTKHEATYKKVLLEMSKQQKSLMEMNSKQSQQIQRLSGFMEKIPSLLGGSRDRSGIMCGYVGSRSTGAASISKSMGPTSTDPQDDCDDSPLPPAVERRQKAIIKQLSHLKIRRHVVTRSKKCAIRSVDKTLAKPLNDDDKKFVVEGKLKMTRKLRKRRKTKKLRSRKIPSSE
jgi:hypothetical protein